MSYLSFFPKFGREGFPSPLPHLVVKKIAPKSVQALYQVRNMLSNKDEPLPNICGRGLGPTIRG
jgi:predicted esterase YcpF (UPF0227 family)